HRPQYPIAEIWLSTRLHRVDVRRAEDVYAGKSCRGQCLLGFALVPCEGNPTSSGRIRPTPAQESERRVGAAAAKHSSKLDRVVHGDSAEFRVRHRAGVSAQTKDRSVLARERP